MYHHHAEKKHPMAQSSVYLRELYFLYPLSSLFS